MIRVLGIDPGYATAGAVLLGWEAGASIASVLWARTIATPPHPKGDVGALVRRCERVADLMLSWCTPDLVAYEMWQRTQGKGSRQIAQETVWARGVLDGVALSQVPDGDALLLPQAQVKGFLHPRGKAADVGRKDELEYASALARLDRLLDADGLSRVRDPERAGGGKFDKHSRLHALDAAAAAALGLLVLSVRRELSCPSYPEQERIAKAIAARPGRR